jgi:hypothetical protein
MNWLKWWIYSVFGASWKGEFLVYFTLVVWMISSAGGYVNMLGTHRQWTFRNGTVHFKGPDGLTQAQQDRLTCRCEELLWTDPSTLLGEDRYLLEIDFESLGDGPPTARQAWISEMEAARAAARFESCEDIQDDIDDQYHSLPTQVDTEGSI